MMIINKNSYKYYQPNWTDLPHIEVFTILSEDEFGHRVSFHRQEPSFDNDKVKIESLFGPIYWLTQVHGNHIIELPFLEPMEGDGLFTKELHTPCAVVTADCLPVVFSDNLGKEIGIAHCGRLGLENQLIHKMMAKFSAPASEIRAWIGPGIAKESYMVNLDIYNSFLNINSSYNAAFEIKDGDYFLDLYQLAKIQLREAGVMSENISGALWNTYSDPLCHSFRRDKQQAGRMLTVIVKKQLKTQ